MPYTKPSTAQHSADELTAKQGASELLENWAIPEVAQDLQQFAGRSNAFGTPLEQLYQGDKANEQTENEADAQTPHPAEAPDLPKLTMESLEKIRQDAFDEGIKQGHEQGYLEGFEKGVTEGKEAGYKEGLTLGKNQGEEDAKPLIEEKLQQLKTVLNALDTPLKNLDEQAEQQLVFLATQLAQAITLTEVKTESAILLKALKAGVDALPVNQAQCQIYLHPDDLALVQQHFSEQELQNRQWQLLAEPSFERGSCEIKQGRSSIDMGIKQRINQVLDTFLHNAGIDAPKN